MYIVRVFVKFVALLTKNWHKILILPLQLSVGERAVMPPPPLHTNK